jgi:Saxitoxin biosynthesis operon protein SxtJ/Family of unknown function (DUF5989)
MALLEINWKPSRRELRQFGCIWLPLFFAIMGWLVYSRTAYPAGGMALWALAAVSVLAGWLAPDRLRLVFVGWMCAAFPIGWVVSHVLMGGVYFLVFTPLGWILRVCGHDPLRLRFDRGAATYWVPHRDRPGNDHYFRQFWRDRELLMSAPDNPTPGQKESEFSRQAAEKSVGVLREFADFLMYNKAWWLTPIVGVLMLVGLLVVLGGTAAGPFIYSFF